MSGDTPAAANAKAHVQLTVQTL